MIKKCVYGIGGLGVDERIFQHLDVTFDIKVLKWIPPLPNESFTSYAERFSKQIDTDESIVIIGISFGGMLAIELCKVLANVRVILLSSTSTNQAIPFIFRLLGQSKLVQVLPNAILQHPPTFVLHWLFGVQRIEHKQLLIKIVESIDPSFLKWAILCIVNWQNSYSPPNTCYIHGKNDRLILPPSESQNVHLIDDGGHFLAITHSKEVSKLLNTLVELD
jgi:pimeloyl-ACP methyl ester carboxylesterase